MICNIIIIGHICFVLTAKRREKTRLLLYKTTCAFRLLFMSTVKHYYSYCIIVGAQDYQH